MLFQEPVRENLKLQEKGLVKIAGRKEAIGRPVLYRTTEKFLEYFGLESISDIPPLEELGIDKEVEELISSIEKEDADSEDNIEQTETLSDEDADMNGKQQPEEELSSENDGSREEEGEKSDGRIQKED